MHMCSAAVESLKIYIRVCCEFSFFGCSYKKMQLKPAHFGASVALTSWRPPLPAPEPHSPQNHVFHSGRRYIWYLWIFLASPIAILVSIPQYKLAEEVGTAAFTPG